MARTVPTEDAQLPERFEQWFASRGWQPREHQLDVLRAMEAGESSLLIAPTGGGKTLAGFLPSLVELSEVPKNERSLHTLYISPLKALAVDIARNLEAPIAEMGLPVVVESRTGDTKQSVRQRQRTAPPDILLTTPEQLSLLLAHPSADSLFSGLRTVVLDELHALRKSKRGDLLSLDLARIRMLAPQVRTIGLSATVDDPVPLQRFLVDQDGTDEALSQLIIGKGEAKASVTVLTPEDDIPWSGHSGRHSFEKIYELIGQHTTTLIFTNTRSQAEVCFQELWRMNEENLPIGLHHGSLEREQRERVEAAMVAGTLKAVVCTATLDMGIDWGAVDLCICLGAPKGAARLVQRIGRSNHRMDEPSRAILVPANRFEVLECVAAKQAVDQGLLDGEPYKEGALDVLCQHIWGMAAAEPFHPDNLYREVISAASYRNLTRETFDEALEFVATGGYAMRAYDRFRRIVKMPDGRMRIKDARTAQLYRMNAGTIIDLPSYNVRLGRMSRTDGRPKAPRGGRKLGTIEEWFLSQITPGDTFIFAGEVLRYEGVQDMDVYVTKATGEDVKIPSWQGSKFPLSSFLANSVRTMVSEPKTWKALPEPVSEWLSLQELKSYLPQPDELLIETFARGGKHYLVCYPFDGRIAHQSLGTLVTRRLERMGLQPLGFCPTEYALSVWMRNDPSDLDMNEVFEPDLLGEDLDLWLADAQLMKRTFRNVAMIAGMIERNHPGQEKNGRQVSFSAGLIYDVLREHQPDHILLKAAWNDASSGFLDIGRLSDLLARISGNLVHKRLERVSPLAVPVMMEAGRETIAGAANEAILEDLERDLLEEMERG
ncbi:ligase-associated DNA damage response DEXH box helicase [Parvularcula sp. ZS-1/3]|uniref:Ligase-associated DNA damage response DEXH box helicase n=1 Tax=Parvularcula mediterranea TaxID=2732508 RepID=A0A7Y3RP25_9PROT|nr:ligase-associated DNA damage response DEXH box helicase [Parvularcula mediterranea]NNU17644.1 ligase-associated DNA damage response DEXH box helicase [Parvularcula mediterranea]